MNALRFPTPQLDALFKDADTPSLWWLSGYAAGLAAVRGPALQVAKNDADPVLTAKVPPPITVIHGSQTGNARRVAEALAGKLEAAGASVQLQRAGGYNLRQLPEERRLLIVISTQGEGDPPDDAVGFVEHLLGRRAPRLPELEFGVLGLGDSSYEHFCGIAQKIDARLEALGAKRWLDYAAADVDYESVCDPWIDTAIGAARISADTSSTASRPLTATSAATEAWSRDKPFHAEVLTNQRITSRESGKDVRHLELSLAGSGLVYAPGDALGVWPSNDPALVAAVLERLGLDPQAVVAHGGQTHPLDAWLTGHREITATSRPFLRAHAARANDAELDRLLEDAHRGEVTALLAETQLIDILIRWPATWTAADLVAELRPLTPRLYSIASSQSEVGGDEVHLTVSRLHYRAGEEDRFGAASHGLCELNEGERISVFIEPNTRFRLPDDNSRDIIMIAAGTGIAPFRGFLQERIRRGATGRNWLIFGNRRQREDFLYQLEWQAALANGTLRMDVAWSRERPLEAGSAAAPPRHVQHAMLAHGAEIYRWLDQGASIYVCGDAKRMAVGVHEALLEILSRHGVSTRGDAEQRISSLLAEGRYARDVY